MDIKTITVRCPVCGATENISYQEWKKNNSISTKNFGQVPGPKKGLAIGGNGTFNGQLIQTCQGCIKETDRSLKIMELHQHFS